MTIEFLHSPISAPSRSALLVAKHLKLPIKIRLVNLLEGEQLKPEFLEINPQHTVPTIIDDGMVLWESRAIMTYLCNQYAPNNQIYPSDIQQRALVDKWLQFDTTLFNLIIDYTGPMFRGNIKLDIEKEKKMCSTLQLLDDHLAKSKYSVGSKLTIADFSLLCSLDLLTNVMDYDISDFKFVAGYQARLKREIFSYNDVCEDGIEEIRNVIRSKIDANPASR